MTRNFTALTFCLLASSSWSVPPECLSQSAAKFQLVEGGQDDGYRPLSSTEQRNTQIARQAVKLSDYRLPQQQINCTDRTISQDEDHGYRPLHPASSSATRKIYPQQVYPYGHKINTIDDTSPRNVYPPVLPGYGVMPYSFGRQD